MPSGMLDRCSSGLLFSTGDVVGSISSIGELAMSSLSPSDRPASLQCFTRDLTRRTALSQVERFLGFVSPFDLAVLRRFGASGFVAHVLDPFGLAVERGLRAFGQEIRH